MDERISSEMRPKTTRQVTYVRRTPIWVSALLFLLLVLVIGTSVVAWNLYKEKKANELVLLSDDKKTIISNIGKHILLPQGEEPVFATVTDPRLLSDQPFFVNAETGDKVLVYQRAQSAILYRPSIDRIIGMAPFDPTTSGVGPVKADR